MKQFVPIMIMIACLLTGCSRLDGLIDIDTASMSTEELIRIIEDPNSDLFVYATEELAIRGADAAQAAPALAQALSYPRRDSYSAGLALVSMGPAAESAIPYLLPTLRNDCADVRADASLVMGAIGAGSKCAISEIACLLWDKDPAVSGAAAVTLDTLTSQNLVPYWQRFNSLTPFSIAQDSPEGTLTKDARIWWEQEGKYTNWKEESDSCDSLED